MQLVKMLLFPEAWRDEYAHHAACKWPSYALAMSPLQSHLLSHTSALLHTLEYRQGQTPRHMTKHGRLQLPTHERAWRLDTHCCCKWDNSTVCAVPWLLLQEEGSRRAISYNPTLTPIHPAKNTLPRTGQTKHNTRQHIPMLPCTYTTSQQVAAANSQPRHTCSAQEALQ